MLMLNGFKDYLLDLGKSENTATAYLRDENCSWFGAVTALEMSRSCCTGLIFWNTYLICAM